MSDLPEIAIWIERFHVAIQQDTGQVPVTCFLGDFLLGKVSDLRAVIGTPCNSDFGASGLHLTAVHSLTHELN